MAISTKTKRGRKPRPYVMADGTVVAGLARRPSDGRWRVVETGFTFTEPDERLAVNRFYQMTSPKVAKMAVATVSGDGNTISEALTRLIPKRKAMIVQSTKITADGSVASSFDISEFASETAVWGWLREQILTRPQYAAQMLGIEQIGYLQDIKRPTASPTLAEIGELYADKPGLSPNEAGRSRLFWKEFSKAVGVATVRELTHDNVAAYEAAVRDEDYAPKSILHRFRKVRTILAYAIKRGKSPEDCRRALDITAMLEIKNHTPLDPKPISVEDFWAIYDAAVEAGDKTFAALMLTALNMCAYAGEVSCLRWEELNEKTGEVVTRRPKTGVSRVAVLWPETLKALNGVPRRGDYVFNTKVRSYTVFSVHDGWRKYREAAGVSEDTHFSMIRDAAFTIACQSGTLDQARMLAGHKLPGVTDHYLRRNPGLVADACKAIRAAFNPRSKS